MTDPKQSQSTTTEVTQDQASSPSTPSSTEAPASSSVDAAASAPAAPSAAEQAAQAAAAEQQGSCAGDEKTAVSAGAGAAKVQSQARAYDDPEEDEVVHKISAEEAKALSEQYQGLPSLVRISQVVVLLMFAFGFVGFYKAYGFEQALSTGGDGSMDYAETLKAIYDLAGPFADMGALGAALWNMLSSFSGGMAVIVPYFLYNYIATEGVNKWFPGTGGVLFDAVKAEIYKYGFMILILGCLFKLTDLVNWVIIATFVICMCAQLVISSYSIGYSAQSKTDLAKPKDHQDTKEEQSSKSDSSK